MWADADTNVDYLNFSEVAELVAELIASRRLLPLSLGVFGSWGTGKSSILRLIEAELGAENSERIRRRLLPEHRGGHVSRQDLGADEDQHRHRQESENTENEPRRNQT